MLTVHCSALPRVLHCPASLVAPGLVVEGKNEAASIGSAVHEALASRVRGGQPDIAEIAAKHGISKDAVFPLYFTGSRIWEEYAGGLAVIGTEMKLSSEFEDGITLQGTADVVARAHQEAKPTLLIVDWKSGKEGNYEDQLKGYAVMAAKDWPSRAIKLMVVYLRDQVVEIVDVDPAEAGRDLSDRLQWAVEHQDRFCPSYESCAYCPRQIECPGRTALVRQAVLDLSTIEQKLNTLAPASLAALYPKAKLLEKVLDHYHATLRNAAAVAPGGLPIGDGRVLRVEEKERSEIVAGKAWPILVELFTVKAMSDAGALDIGKGALCELVRSKAPRGEKAEALRRFMDRLEAVAAISKTTYKTLTVGKGESNGGSDKRIGSA